MLYALPILYVVVLLLWLLRGRHFRTIGLPHWFLGAVFVVKSLLAVMFLWVHMNYYNGADTARYISDGEIIYHTLFENPAQYLLLTFGPNNLATIPPLIAEQVEAMGYWFDDGAYMMVRFNALARLFSFGNQYVHGVFVAFLSTLGMWWLFKTLQQKGVPVWPLALGVFGLPSTLFWTSGVHKEGLLAFFLGGFVYSVFWKADFRLNKGLWQ